MSKEICKEKNDEKGPAAAELGIGYNRRGSFSIGHPIDSL